MSVGPAATQDHRAVEIRIRQAGIAALIDVHPVRAFAVLSAIYFVVVFVQSSLKLLWLDELITLHLARLSSFHELWHALAVGADPNPVITYVLVHWARAILGDHEFALRLPSALGYWIGLASLFAFLKQRLYGSWAILGCLVSMAMAAFDYSFESRSYAIFYGFAMLAFLCWTYAIRPGGSSPAQWAGLAGMTLALMAGISTNYFAVLAFAPIAVGEVARTWLRARNGTPKSSTESPTAGHSFWYRVCSAIDIRVWLALLISGTTLLIYRPLIARSIAEFSPYAWNKVSLDQVFDSYTEMVEIILYPILALLAFGALAFFLKPGRSGLCKTCRDRISPRWLAAILTPQQSRPPLTLYEAASVFTFAAYPVCGFVIASIRGGMLSPRFVIPVCFGFAIATAVVAQYLFANLRYAATVLLCIVSAWFLCREAVVGYWYALQKESFYKLVDLVQQDALRLPQDSPIAIPDPLLALTFRHYAPAPLASRVVFPVDFPAIRYFRHDDSPEENLWAGRNLIYSMSIVPIADLQGSSRRYLIVASPGNWMLEDLEKHRYGFIPLPMGGRAGDLGGFTPLAHGVPELFEAHGDPSPEPLEFYSRPPAPFQRSANLPEAKWYAPPELLNDD